MKGALETSSPAGTYGQEESLVSDAVASKEQITRCCFCCIASRGCFICSNITLAIHSLFIGILFVALLFLTYCNSDSLMAYAITALIMRVFISVSGYIVILKKSIYISWALPFGISIIFFTVLSDIVFGVYLNYVFLAIDKSDMIQKQTSLSYGSLAPLHIIWLIDSLFAIYFSIKYVQFTHIDARSEFIKYKVHYGSLLLIALTLFIWGIIQTVITMSGSTTLIVHEQGYSIEYYVDYNSIRRPHQLQSVLHNDTSIIYVCAEDGVYALIDWDNDQQNDAKWNILPSIERSCTSVAVDPLNDYLFITEWEKTYRCKMEETTTYPNIHALVLAENSIESQCSLWFEQEFYSQHGWHLTVMNPYSNALCIAEGVACNICEPVYPQGAIICFDDMEHPKWENSTIFAQGIRDSVGFAFDENGTLWFTDHNTDKIAFDKPDCELNKVSFVGEHFGFPYCHSLGEGNEYLRAAGKSSSLLDELYGADGGSDCDVFTKSVQPLGPHVAPDGVAFIDSLSNETHRVLLVAEHGSWARDKYIGYRIGKVLIDRSDDSVVDHQILLDGWLDDDKQLFSGRPVHLLELHDGSFLISDDFAHTIYRVSYDPQGTAPGITQKLHGGHVDKVANWMTSYKREG